MKLNMIDNRGKRLDYFQKYTITHFLLYSVKEWRGQIGIEKIRPPLEELRVLGGDGQGRQIQGHSAASSGSSVGPHMRAHVHLRIKRTVCVWSNRLHQVRVCICMCVLLIFHRACDHSSFIPSRFVRYALALVQAVAASWCQ